jgi:hypothetical protein
MLRGEQKEISKADIAAAAPPASESRDISAESETRSVDAPREVEGPAADEAKETPIDSRVEYDHPPEASNDPVSDTSAESNVIENKEPTVEAKNEPTSSAEGEESAAREPKDSGAELGTELAHEHDIMETDAVSIPSESNNDNAEVSQPESQEPNLEIHDHEAQDGDESDHLKAEGESSDLEVHASDKAAVPEHLASVESENSHHRLEKEEAETVPASSEEPTAAEGKAINSVAEDKPPENAEATNEENNDVSDSETLSTEPVSDVEASPATEAREVEDHAEVVDHVTGDQQIAHSSDPTIAKDESSDFLGKENLEGAGSALNQEQEAEEKSVSNEHQSDNQPEHEHVETVTDEPNIEKPSEYLVKHAADEPIQTEKIAEGEATIESPKDELVEVEEHAKERLSTATAEADLPLEGRSIQDKESSASAEEFHQDANEDELEVESEDAWVLEKETSVPEEEHSMANDIPIDSAPPRAAIAWWEKNGQEETPANKTLDESSWHLRSLPGVEQPSVEKHLPAQPLNTEAVEEHAEGFEKQTLNDQDEHVKQEDHSETEEREISEAISPAISEEYSNETPYLSDIEEEHEDGERIIAAEEVTPQGEEEDLAPISLKSFPQDQIDTNNDHASSEIYSHPVERPESYATSSHEDSCQIHVEEREADSGSETVEHPEIEPANAVDGKGHEASKISSAPDHPDEQSTPNDHAFHESEAREEEDLNQSDSPVPHSDSHQIEYADNLHAGTDESSRAPEDQERDILDDYASNDLTPREENHPGLSQEGVVKESWRLQHAPHHEPEPTEHEVSNERPVTPTQASHAFDFAPSTPRHLIQEENHYGLTESPAAVLDADNLFEDDEEDEDQQQVGGHEYGRGAFQENTAQSSEQVHDFQREETKKATTHDKPETRPSFGSLVDTIRPDISLLRQLANQGSSAAHTPLDDDHSMSEYSQATPGEYFTPGPIELATPFTPQEPDAALHIRTHIADTIPSFESRAQSDEASTPTTPSEAASSPFVEDPRAEPNIRSSWQDNSALQGSDPTEPQQELKAQASPLQGEFDLYNTQTYPNYTSPRTSQVSLRPEKSPRNSFSYTGGFEGPRFSTQSSISSPPPPVPAKSPRLSSLNTSQASQFAEGRPYDSPVSTTRSHHESET